MDWRREKKADIYGQLGGHAAAAKYLAWVEGCWWGEIDRIYSQRRGKVKKNPYPPGKRHDEWQRGYDLADPLGDWHGRNK